MSVIVTRGIPSRSVSWPSIVPAPIVYPGPCWVVFRSLFPFQKPILRANREANFQHWIIVSVCCLTITSRRMNSFARGLLVVITESRTKRDLSSGHLDDDWCYRLGGRGKTASERKFEIAKVIVLQKVQPTLSSQKGLILQIKPS